MGPNYSSKLTLAIQFTGNNRQALIEFIGENYVCDDKIKDLIQELPPELSKTKPPEDFFEILRIIIDRCIPSPYMLQIYAQDWLVKKKESAEDIYQFSVLGDTEFQYVRTAIEERSFYEIQFTGEIKKLSFDGSANNIFMPGRSLIQKKVKNFAW